jgi:hypothetical protein
MSEQILPAWELDADVADWLIAYSKERFGGDIERTLNVLLKSSMIMHQNPEDRWAALDYEKGIRGPRKRVRDRGQDPGSTESDPNRA